MEVLILRRSMWLAVAFGIFVATVHAGGQAQHCTAPQYRQFDFWIGNWDAFDFETGERDAHVRVTRILDGCALHEQYAGSDGHLGESFTIYDASRKVWHQTWVTNRGELLTIEGTYQDGTMVLAGASLDPEGQEKRVRGTWKQVKGGVREMAVTSSDGGKTWKPWFDLLFRPAPSMEHRNSE